MEAVIHTAISGMLARILSVILTSALPFVENKGAILFAAALKMKWYFAYALTCIGSFAPVPFLLKLWRSGAQPRGRLVTAVKRALDQHGEILHKYGPWALFLLVSIPLTGIGCWIGSILADLCNMDRKRSAVAIACGTLVSGLIMTLGVYGLIGGIRYLFR